MRIDVVSIFPEYLAPLDLSLIGKARRDGVLDVRVHDLREFTRDRHRTVDDTPYGGGAGMVMKPEPWAEALDAVAASAGDGAARPRLLVPGPGGVPFTQAMARDLATEPWLAFACGRYEGIDERVLEYAADDLGLDVTVVSLGDYVLNGGEVAVLAVTEAVARLLPGVIGNAESLVEESHEDGLLEYPVYTRPAVWTSPAGTTREVPAVLLSGDHAAIADWRHQQRLERTAARRPDLLHASSTTGALADLEPAVAGPGDAPELLTLGRAVAAGRVADTGALTGAGVDGLDAVVESLRHWRTWVFRAAGRLVAAVSARVDPDDAEAWQVGRVLVAPDLAGRGLERELVAFAEAQAPSGTAAYRLTIVAGDELRTYRKAGYRPRPGGEAGPVGADLVKRRR